jgi:tetratricopeptide (TPR) repeat protein
VAEPVPERELTPAERLAVEARDLLTAGDASGALRMAQRAAVMAPDIFLCRLVLGDVYLHTGAMEDALREFRRAAELDPDSVEAKERAELARRRLTHPSEAAPTGPRDWRARLVERKQLVAIAAGAIAALLVFAVGAAAIVGHSPSAQIGRAYRRQMELGREHYKTGRYEDAARAFEQAARLRPSSAEAQRRLQDALAVAGLGPSATPAPPVATGDRVASIMPLNPYPVMPPAYVGPVPKSAQPAHALTGGAPAPPPIPEPLHSGLPPATDRVDLPPPIPESPLTPTVDHTQGPARTEPPAPSDIGREVPDESRPAEPPGPPTEQRKTGHIMIKRHEAPTTRTPTATAAPPVPAADALRDEANRLRDSGQAAAAAQRFGEAAARYREEARQGGAGAAVKLRAAASCERAQQLCGTQGN